MIWRAWVWVLVLLQRTFGAIQLSLHPLITPLVFQRLPGDLEVGLSVLKAILGVLDARLRCLIDRRTDRQMDRDKEAYSISMD